MHATLDGSREGAYLPQAKGEAVSLEQDKDDLLDVLYAMSTVPGTRPSIQQARMSYFPEWDKARLLAAREALEASGDIMNPISIMLYVDLTSLGRKRAAARAAPPPAQTINIGTNQNSPIQQIGSGASGVQNVRQEMSKTDLHAIVDLYRRHVDELNLDAATRRRADAQVATIHAQLQDEPDPTVIRAAGKSLRTIIEGAIGSALGNVAANPNVWVPLLSLFS
jgi:hypothetical protein